jgi:exosortase
MTQAAPGNKLSLTLAALAGLAAVAAWTFWPTLSELSQKWFHDPQYSHGILVPFFAGYVLWARRELYRGDTSPQLLLGLGCLLIAGVCRVASGMFVFTWVDAIAILPCFFGLALLAGGRAALRWSWPAVAFLFFMIPLPYSVEIALGGPLQKVATLGSAFMLQALGQPAVAEGNTIMLNDVKLGIVEACSGLRMLVTFFTFSTGVAMLIRKPWLEKMCIVLSAIPIALLTNIIRITATGVMYQNHKEFAHMFFHDLAGWFMMPVCLAFLGLELWILNRLIIEGRQSKPLLAVR